jgi:hypothetical protein
VGRCSRRRQGGVLQSPQDHVAVSEDLVAPGTARVMALGFSGGRSPRFLEGVVLLGTWGPGRFRLDLAAPPEPLRLVGQCVGDRAESDAEFGLCPCRTDPLAGAVDEHTGSSRGDQRRSSAKSIRELQQSRSGQRQARRHSAGCRDSAQLGNLRAGSGKLMALPGNNIPAVLRRLGGPDTSMDDVAYVNDVSADPVMRGLSSAGRRRRLWLVAYCGG